jgi:uncharacterized protein YdeI (YjbR/CyaY-like superfamily)
MKAEVTPRYFRTREEWRRWLHENHDKASDIWFVFPLRSSGETAISYNDAVEEALCFGWIDSTAGSLDEHHRIQRFSPRRPGSTYSQANKERLRWLLDNDLVHTSVRESVSSVIAEPFVYPPDIMEAIQADPEAWANFQRFSEPYKRIRISFIDAARRRPEEFKKRFDHFLDKTKKGKLIIGFGGIDKYYGWNDP